MLKCWTRQLLLLTLCSLMHKKRRVKSSSCLAWQFSKPVLAALVAPETRKPMPHFSKQYINSA
jgi:hypothetical protein